MKRRAFLKVEDKSKLSQASSDWGGNAVRPDPPNIPPEFRPEFTGLFAESGCEVNNVMVLGRLFICCYQSGGFVTTIQASRPIWLKSQNQVHQNYEIVLRWLRNRSGVNRRLWFVCLELNWSANTGFGCRLQSQVSWWSDFPVFLSINFTKMDWVESPHEHIMQFWICFCHSDNCFWWLQFKMIRCPHPPGRVGWPYHKSCFRRSRMFHNNNYSKHFSKNPSWSHTISSHPFATALRTMPRTQTRRENSPLDFG